MFKKILIGVLAGFTFASAAYAGGGCYGSTEVVTLRGTLKNSVVQIDPKDFPWSKDTNGIVKFQVLELPFTICLKDEDGQVSQTSSLHVFPVPFSDSAVLSNGIEAELTGTLFPEHTAHHFKPILMNIDSLTISPSAGR